MSAHLFQVAGLIRSKTKEYRLILAQTRGEMRPVPFGRTL